MTRADWTALLDEPKAILGPCHGAAPSLAEFAPHAWRTHFNQVAIAGHFEFYDVRLLRVDGILESDDIWFVDTGITRPWKIKSAARSYSVISRVVTQRLAIFPGIDL